MSPPPTPSTSRFGRFFDRFGPRRARATVDMLRNSAAEAQKSRLPQMAAALSYRTVFGLIPVFVVSLVAIRVFFTTNDDITSLLGNILSYTGLSSISVGDPAMMGPFPEGQDPAVLPPPAAGNEQLDRWIKDLVEKVSGINFAAVGYVSLAALLYAAISMLVEIERAFNQTFRVPVGRSWVRRLTQYWTMLTLGTIGLAATFWVGQKFTGWVEGAADWGESRATIVGAIGYLTTVAISTGLLLLAYTVVPNTKVKLLPALIGALLAAILWEAGKWGFTQYLQHTRGYARLYGSLALVPLFLLWVYVTWAIVLYGLSVAYYLQHGRHQTRAQPMDLGPPVIVDPAATLAVMAALAKRFESGSPADASEIAREVGVQAAIARQMLERLAGAGLIHAVREAGAGEEAEPRYVLARPPERIDAGEVLRVGEDMAGITGRAPVVESVVESRLERLRGRTLAAFMGLPALPDAPPDTAPSSQPAGPRERPAQPVTVNS